MSLPPRGRCDRRKHYISDMRTSSAGRLVAVTLLLGWLGSTPVRAEIISVPPADPPDPAASLAPPTVLRGSPPATVKPVPICPPGYTVTADYGCVTPSGRDYTESGPGYDYWPDYGWGYPFGGFPGFGFGTNRGHRFDGLHGGHGFHRKAGFRGAARFAPHSAARFAPQGAAMGHMGGFGRR